MINRKQIRSFQKALPIICASAITVAGCSAEQAGDTNSGLSGGLAGGVSGTTVLGVVGGVALAGLLLNSDDDDSSGSVVDGNGATNGTDTGGNGGTDTGGTGGTDTGGTGGTDTGGTGGTDTGGTGGTDTGGTGGTDTGGTGGTDTGGTGGTDTGGTGGTDTGGTGGTDTGGTGGGTSTSVTLADTGSVQTQLVESETVPNSGSSGLGDVDLTFDRNTGNVSGTVTLTGVTATSVDIMVGPPGSNGFVAVALEMTGPNEWSVPASLSAAQQAFVLQNVNSGNLYVAATSAAFPNGEIRRQLTPANVTLYTTNVSGTNGGSAQGFLLVNESSGEYSITWNTSDNTLISAHVNDGVVSGSTENNYALLTQRASNPARFFLDGNFNNPADPLYPDLLDRLSNGTVWLDAHAADDSRVFFGQLQ